MGWGEIGENLPEQLQSDLANIEMKMIAFIIPLFLQRAQGSLHGISLPFYLHKNLVGYVRLKENEYTVTIYISVLGIEDVKLNIVCKVQLLAQHSDLCYLKGCGLVLNFHYRQWCHS